MLLNSKIFGTGNKTLVVLHGFLGMLDNWKTFAKKMVGYDYKIHLLDQRNHGKSFHNNEFNYQIMAEDLHHYVTYHNIKKFSLIGHSMGGKTAMMFSSFFPEFIDKMIVVDILPIYYKNDYATILNSLKSLDLEKLRTRSEIDKALENDFKELSFRSFLLKNLHRIDKDKLGFKIDLDIILNNLNEVEKSLPNKLFYGGEVLFVKGEKSNYINDSNINSLINQFPKYKIVEIQNAGHWVHAENLNDFIKETLLFLES